jgi:hypothetical protein
VEGNYVQLRYKCEVKLLSIAALLVTIAPGRTLDSAVMTTWAGPRSSISHGLLAVRSWLTDTSTDVAPGFIVLYYHMTVWLTDS